MQAHRRGKKAVFIALPLVIIVIVIAFVAAVGAVVDRGNRENPSRLLVPKGRFSTDGLTTGAVGDTSTSMPETAAGGDASAPSELGYGPSVLDPARYLVRTGDMTVVVDKGGVPEAAGRVSSIAAGFNGYVTNSQITIPQDGQRPYATITVKVPSRNYDQAIARFGELGEVDSLNTATDDVTAQFVDVKARLSHYRAVERRLLGFLARTTTISEALTVQQRIEATQLQVEELSAQLKAMRNQVVFGTLSVAITESSTKAAPAADENSFVAALGDSWRLMVKGFEVIVIAFGALLPFVILFVVLGLLVWGGVRFAGRLRRHPAGAA